jgi:hypothetical protein
MRKEDKSVQAPSCKRPKTTGTQRTLFLSFEIINCFPITVPIVSEFYEKIRETCMPRGEFKHRYRYWFFGDTPNVAWFVSVI